ncbi:MAG: hypothetical protein ACOYXT_23830 [Bacteroidota bacterium]
MKSNLHYFHLSIIALIMLVFIWSCETNETLAPQKDDQFFLPGTQSMTKLGKKLENPYAVKNMRKAWENLKASKINRRSQEDIAITVTHLYVKFKPQNEDELAILKRDSTLILYEYPLDYEIVEAGTFYHDPKVPIGVPTYQYVSIPIGKQIPKGIEYELLEELFIPDDYADANGGRIASIALTEALVDEALKITGNSEEGPSSANGRTQSRSWRPAGRIRVLDDSIVPNDWRSIEGVKVKARRWFTTHEGITNAEGYYSCDGTFKRDANYSLDWERYQFALREGWLNGANVNGPKKDGDWNLDFSGGVSMFHARVFMAAYHYYYQDIKGLRRPPENGNFNTQMRIRCYYEENAHSNGNHVEERRFLGLGSQIKIYNPQNPFVDIYSTTIHELAHASHWNMWRNGNDFDNTESIVKESWARGVQWELTRMVWAGYPGAGEIRPNYTLVVIDMIDASAPLNQLGVSEDINLGTEKLEQDDVSGYNIRQIEDALRGKTNWIEWRENIKNNYDNATENNLDALFDYWN